MHRTGEVLIENKVTIIIPTYNRHRQLERILDYYSGYKFQILVADSTNSAFPKAAKYKRVKYFHYPKVGYSDKLPLIYQKVKTDYVLFCADDDFVVPEGIKKCVKFLEKNSDYTSAHGHYVFFEPKVDKRIKVYPFYLYATNIDIYGYTPSERVKQVLSPYMQLLYAVTRTKDIKEVFKILKNNSKIKNDNLVEMLQTIVLCINGKSKTLPVFYCARENTPNSARTFTDDLDIIATDKKYTKEYSIWIEAIAEQLSKKGLLKHAEAEIQVKEAIDAYLQGLLIKLPFFNIHILQTQRILNMISFGLAKKIYNAILPSDNQLNLKKHAFRKSQGKQEFKKIESYIKKYVLVTN